MTLGTNMKNMFAGRISWLQDDYDPLMLCRCKITKYNLVIWFCSSVLFL